MGMPRCLTAGPAVNGSRFPLASCLVLSAFFMERSQKDLTQEESLVELAKNYASR